MRILIVSPFLYGKASPSGGEALGRAMLERLATRHSLTMVAFTSGQTEPELAADVAEVSGWMEDVRVVTRAPSKAQRILSKLALLRGEPTVPALYDLPEFVEAIKSSLQDLPPDLIIVQFPELAQFVDLFEDYPTVFDVVDVYSVSKFRRCLQAEGLLRRVWNYGQWLSWINYERRQYAKFDAVFTLTDQDTYGLKLFSPSIAASTAGVAFEPPAPEIFSKQAVPDTIGFAASFSHRPNVDGIEFFMDRVMPIVRQKHPAARFVVAGRNPPAHLKARSAEGLEFAGFVPDIYEFFRSCSVTAIPLLWGGGVKIKVVQALQAGAPIVTTSVGAEGTGAENGRDFVVEDSVAGFADRVVELLQNSEKRDRLGAAAQSFAADAYCWDRKLAALEGVFAQARENFEKRAKA